MADTSRLSVAEVFTELQEALDFRWIAGHEGSQRQLTRPEESRHELRLLGPLNLNSPYRIQLLGKAEVRLYRESRELAAERFEYSLRDTCELFVLSDDLEPPEAITQLATEARIPVFVSSQPYAELQKNLRRRLTERLSERRIIHGVLMDVLGTGVLLTGSARLGKSELALELISRGHILVADDAPEFTRIAPGTLEGRCPPMLQDFLEVRGLGVLNIARMYGNAHTRSRKVLRFIVHLELQAGSKGPGDAAPDEADRLDSAGGHRRILGVDIPQRILPVAPGRNLAVLVEAAVREHILRADGYNATDDLVEKQARELANS